MILNLSSVPMVEKIARREAIVQLPALDCLFMWKLSRARQIVG
jgi:hypothetical protein